MEWGTPVLFMRAPKGDIFRVQSGQPADIASTMAPEPTPAPRIDRDQEMHLAQLYTQGVRAFWEEDWQQAVDSFEAITETRTGFWDTATKLAEAKRQLRFQMLYVQAQAAEGAGAWLRAASTLETLLAEAPDYKDAAARLERARHQQRLASLYTQAHQLHQDQQWRAIVDLFNQIRDLEPDFADPAGLLKEAEGHLAEHKRQDQLQNLYQRAMQDLEAGAWDEARDLLQHLWDTQPGFRDTERALAWVNEQISRRDAELQRQAELSEQSAAASAAEKAGDWLTAIAALESLVAEAPDFEDATARLEAARRE